MHDRIVYVALAEARGHLMRAHLLRERLLGHGIAVEVVTTSVPGQRFLAALATPAELLPGGAALVSDGAPNLCRRATTTALLRYLARPSGMRADRTWLLERARGAAFVVSDSLHPALLFASPSMRVVQVHGQNILRATQAEVAGLGPFVALGARVLERALGGAFACIEHRLGEAPSPSRGPIRSRPRAPARTAGPRASCSSSTERMRTPTPGPPRTTHDHDAHDEHETHDPRIRFCRPRARDPQPRRRPDRSLRHRLAAARARRAA